MMTNRQKEILTSGLVTAGLGFGAYYFYTILVRQLKQTPVDAPPVLKNALTPGNQSSNITNEPLNPQTGTKSGGQSLQYTPLSTYNYTNWAEMIHDAMRPFTRNAFGQILAVFQKLQTQGDVRGVAVMFQALYDIDFWSFLQDGYGAWILGNGLSSEHLNILKDYVSKLPNGAPAAKKETAKKSAVKGIEWQKKYINYQ